MILEKMTKDEVLELLKPHLLKCTKDVSVGIIQFYKGHCYLFDQNEGGNWLQDNNGNWVDLYDLEGDIVAFEKLV